MSEYSVEELRKFLDGRWREFADARGLSEPLEITEPLHEEEADFLHAIHGPRSVITMGPGPGEFEPIGIDPGGSGKSTYTLFSVPEGLNRQYLIQVVALRRLTNDYGWFASQLQMERSKFDVLALDKQRRIAIAGIADKSAAELDRRSRRIRTLAVDSEPKPATVDGRIAEAIQLNRPTVFWAVAPGRSEVFDVVAEGDRLRFEPRSDLPRRSS